MSKFKIGDRVRRIKGARSHISKKEGEIFTIVSIDKDGDIKDEKNMNHFKENLELAEKTLDDLEVGDIVVCKSGEKKVLEANYMLSMLDNFDKRDCCYSAEELKIFGYTIKSTSPETTLTLQEIADKFNIDVSTLRIKDK